MQPRQLHILLGAELLELVDPRQIAEHHHGRLASFFGSTTGEEVQEQAACEVILA